MGWSKHLAVVFAGLLFLMSPPVWAEQQHGVVLLYHHVSSDTPPSTSVSPARFDEHLSLLVAEGYQVLDLEQMLAALAHNQMVPDKAVAITFDDGYTSVLEEAAPRLAERGLPFTVFISTAQVGQGAAYLNWAQLRQIQQLGGKVANHGTQHAHMALPEATESLEQWRTRVKDEISRAQHQLETQLGEVVPLFAYPYGEYSKDLKDVVAELDLMGLAQHSGAVGADSDYRALPRHPFYSGADDLKRFRERLNTYPLTLRAVPESGHESTSEWQRLQLSVLPGLYQRDRLACFFKGEPLAGVSTEGSFTLQVGPLTSGRNVVICTAPTRATQGYAWGSHLLLVK